MEDKQEMNLGNVDKLIQGQEVDEETQHQMDAYIMTLMNIVHSDQTGNSMVELLKAGPPEQSVPQASLEANAIVEKALKGKGIEPKDEVKMAGAMYLAADLTELGNSSGAWEQPVEDPQAVIGYFQSTLQKYVHKGIKEGTIDPVELQAQTEPMLNEQQLAVGIKGAEALELPPSPTASMGMDEYAKRKSAPMEEENQKLKGLLAQQGGQGGV